MTSCFQDVAVFQRVLFFAETSFSTEQHLLELIKEYCFCAQHCISVYFSRQMFQFILTSTPRLWKGQNCGEKGPQRCLVCVLCVFICKLSPGHITPPHRTQYIICITQLHEFSRDCAKIARYCNRHANMEVHSMTCVELCYRTVHQVKLHCICACTCTCILTGPKYVPYSSCLMVSKESQKGHGKRNKGLAISAPASAG